MKQRRPSFFREINARGDGNRVTRGWVVVEALVAQGVGVFLWLGVGVGVGLRFFEILREILSETHERALARAPIGLRKKHITRVTVKARHDEHASAVHGHAETCALYAKEGGGEVSEKRVDFLFKIEFTESCD